MASHTIREVSVRPVAPAGGPDGVVDGHALFLALELADPGMLPIALAEAVERFKLERTAAPPDTRFMLITVTGELAAADFALAWQGAIAHDAVARALVGMLQQADVMQLDREGRVLATVSLLGDGGDGESRSPARGDR